MAATATELVRELVKLESDYRDYSRSPEFKLAEVWHPMPGGFLEKYQARVKELQKEIASIH